jgi:hypothetical protein
MKSTPANSSKPAAAEQLPNPTMVAELLRHMQHNGLDPASMKDRGIIGKRLGYQDGTQVYRFITKDKWAGDVQKFQTRLESYLSNELRIEGGGDLIDDPASFIQPSMFAFLDQVRVTGNIGVAHAPGGVAKTCTCRLYVKQHKATTLYIHLYTWTRRQGCIVRELLKAAGLNLGRGEAPETILARHLRDTESMIIIDNAQRMTRHARDWMRDFLDLTGTPIALVGNPEIIDQWAKCDQHKRVVGLKRDVSLDLFDPDPALNTSERTVQLLIKRHLPEATGNASVKKQALKIITAKDSGACGAVVMHAKLAHLMLQGGKIKDPAEAFTLASTQLIQKEAA